MAQQTPLKSSQPVVTIKLASTSDELLQCYALRAAVFMGEQQCPYREEFDGNDYSASHLMLYVDGEPAASMQVRWFLDRTPDELRESKMETESCSIDGAVVTTKLAGRMEDTLQAFAVRSACFIDEQEVPYSEEFDGLDFGATHLLACHGEEPVGTLRIRWFQSFAVPERLAVTQRLLGHKVGRLLLDRALAENQGRKILYSRPSPDQAGYFAKQGWRQLDDGQTPETRRTVALIRPVDPAKESAQIADTDARALSTQYRSDMPAAVSA